ncbi:lipase family protein [Leptolyngbya cf. ectocarpi LEGE 11479]|uniref:Lipase family protein n=1 Tax=Leptolyngbya cf. ectocarpi LEGE 11479 TaxID=1828722 RepID=A0A928X1H6_LEPEC|nr:lipase family protein [Leptolyngbya ectocarpi]MBE9065656.1 lipase family protein [Leptolyngbya cf. ectocarpi LEGE 11479]
MINSKIPPTLQSGFSFDEALLTAGFCKQIYAIFQQDDGSVDDTELEEIYNAVHGRQGWKFAHSIRNDDTNVRGMILKRQDAQQYTVVFRGSILTDRGGVELTDLATDMQWDLVKYGTMTDAKVKVVQGLFLAFESVADEIKLFFKTLAGQLKSKDFQSLNQLSPERTLACATAMADAGTIRLGAEFEQPVKGLIAEALEDGEIGNNDELEHIIAVEQAALLKLDALPEPLEVYVTGHSLGGGLAHLGALALHRNLKAASIKTKTYSIAAPKVGNDAFAQYYHQQIPEGMSYRIENWFDPVPNLPLSVPFPLSMFAASGLRIGDFYLGDCVPVGESHNVVGLGSQGVSIDFGGALEFLGGIPFPHSFDTYIMLLKEDQERWQGIWRPIQDVLGTFIKGVLQDHQAEIQATFQAEIQALKQAVDSLSMEIQTLKQERQTASLNNSQPVETEK